MKSIFELPTNLEGFVPKIQVAHWPRLLFFQACLGALAWLAASEIIRVKADMETSWMPEFFAGTFALATLAVCLLYSNRWLRTESDSGLPRAEGLIWLLVSGGLFCPIFLQKVGIADWLSVFNLFYFQIPLAYFLYWLVRQYIKKEIPDPAITHFIEKKEMIETASKEGHHYFKVSDGLYAYCNKDELENGEIDVLYFLKENSAVLIKPDGQAKPISYWYPIEPYQYYVEAPNASEDWGLMG